MGEDVSESELLYAWCLLTAEYNEVNNNKDRERLSKILEMLELLLGTGLKNK